MSLVSSPICLTQYFLELCRVCYYATKSRQLWCDLVKGLQESSFRRPEERLNEYSTEKLEEWVLLRLRSQVLWKARISPTFRSRPFEASLASTKYQSIIPGGRWRLTLGSGVVCVVDLDAHQPEPRLLFNPGSFTKTGRPDEVTRCSYWIDDSKPRLSFYVGVCCDKLFPVSINRGKFD